VLDFNVELHSGWFLTTELNLLDPGRAYCVSCARGGPALRRSPGHEISFGADGDPRRSLIPHLAAAFTHGDAGRSWSSAAFASLEMRAGSRFAAELGAEVERRTDDMQWVANVADPATSDTAYTFARLRQTTVALIARASFTATPTLSFQLYAQPFVSSGSFADWRALADARAADHAARFRPFGDGAVPDGFNVKQFNSNVVARWEYRRGSTLYLVWQQGREQDERNPGSFRFARDYRDLFRARPDNTFLIKASYWFNP
jgi:hypothetical protein